MQDFRWLDKKRYLGDVEGEVIADRLNFYDRMGWKDLAAPVLQVLAALGELDQFIGQNRKLKPGTEELPAFRHTVSKLNRILKTFSSSPHMKHSARSLWLVNAPCSRDVEVAEFLDVQRLLALWNGGLLDRVRQCGQCKKWFFAGPPHKAHCSVACKHKALQSKESFKERRRRYMRKYYKDHLSSKK